MSEKEKRQEVHIDVILLVLVLILVAFGLVMLFSASEYNGRVRFDDSAYYFKKQLFATALGLMAMYLVSQMDYRVLQKWRRLHIFSLLCFLQQCSLWGRRSTVPKGG